MLHRAARFAMGTRFEVVIEGRDDAHGRAAAEGALAVIEDCDGRWSRFAKDSLVARVNREAGERWVRLDAETFELLSRCLAWTRASDGAFDVCVGRAMDRLRAGETEPGAAGAFELDPERRAVRFTRPDSALDLGAIAKGFALDLAAASLREAGVTRALLHGGTSSVLALGAPPESRESPESPGGWRIGLGPEFGAETVALRDRALSISAARGSRDLEARPHVLDPRDGRVLTRDLRVAVSAEAAAEAEAWSTALVVLQARGAEGEELDLPRSMPAELTWRVGDRIPAARGEDVPRGSQERSPTRPKRSRS